MLDEEGSVHAMKACNTYCSSKKKWLHKHASVLRLKYTACSAKVLNIKPNDLPQSKFTSLNVCFQILGLGAAYRKADNVMD